MKSADVCSVFAQKGDGEFGVHLCGFYIKKYPAHHCGGYLMNEIIINKELVYLLFKSSYSFTPL